MSIRFYRTPSKDFHSYACMVERCLLLQQSYFKAVKDTSGYTDGVQISQRLFDSKAYERATDTTSIKALELANSEGDTAFINFVEDYLQLRSRQRLFFKMKGEPGIYPEEERKKILGECIARERGLLKSINEVKERYIALPQLLPEDNPIIPITINSEPSISLPKPEVSVSRVSHNDAPCWECEDSFECINGRYCSLLRCYVQWQAKNCPKQIEECS